jgi:hypothetical protein
VGANGESVSEQAKADAREASVDGIQNVYLIVLGLAMSEALLRTFTNQPADGAFLGRKVFELERLPHLVLALAFLFTSIRFAHGSLIYIKTLSHADVWHWDLLALVSQAILFFLAAIAIGEPQNFVLQFAGIFFIDFIWIVVISRSKGKKRWKALTGLEKQWAASNFSLTFVFMGALFIVENDVVLATIVAVFSLIGAIADYGMNKEFYFPPAVETENT